MLRLLLAEDNPGDVRLAQEALRDLRIRNPLDVVSNGEEALAYLRGTGRYSGVPRPALVFLDFTLPRMDGVEVWEEMRRDPELRAISTVIMAGVPLEPGLLERYGVPAKHVIAKPLTADLLFEALQCCSELEVEIHLPQSNRMAAA